MEYFVGFFVLLGVLVFFHELGHFLVAKAFGMRVETFSIGMGKKILRFRRGETEYALSLLPLGGYVKITGQDPRENLSPELETRSFQKKPLWQRAAVVLAGPLFNAALAVVVLTILYGVGVPVQAPVLERVLEGSPAYEAGFRSGDRIEWVSSATGKVSYQVRELGDLEEAVGENAGKPLIFTVKRGPTNQLVHFKPVLGKDRDSTIGVFKERGTIPGFEKRQAAPVVTVLKDSWAEKNKIPNSFWVDELHLNLGGGDKKIVKTLKIQNYMGLENAWRLIYNSRSENPADLLRKALGQSKKEVTATKTVSIPLSGEIKLIGHTIRVETEENASGKAPEESPPETITIKWADGKGLPPASVRLAGMVSSELAVISVKPESPAAKMGLKEGDVLQTLNDEPVRSFASFREKVQSLATQGQPLKLSWIREGKPITADVKPEVVSMADPLTEVKKDQFQIGAMFLALPAMPTLDTLKAANPFEAIKLGWVKTWSLTGSMLSSFYHLAKGDISFKTMGGPILIGKIAGESFKQGYVHFMRTIAFISLNLFILNLFPIPVLDGGHLILYTIEALRRKPLNARIVEVWTTAGFFLLMSLVAVVFFNDLNRLGLFGRLFS